jgi:hypothetical protein
MERRLKNQQLGKARTLKAKLNLESLQKDSQQDSCVIASTKTDKPIFVNN